MNELGASESPNLKMRAGDGVSTEAALLVAELFASFGILIAPLSPPYISIWSFRFHIGAWCHE